MQDPIARTTALEKIETSLLSQAWSHNGKRFQYTIYNYSFLVKQNEDRTLPYSKLVTKQKIGNKPDEDWWKL